MAGGLHSLSEDIYAIILKQIYLTAPETLPVLYQVDKRFYHHTKPLLYRSVSLNPLKLKKLDDAKLSSFSHDLRGNIALFTRELLIQGVGFDWRLLARVLRQFKRLETLLWRSWDQPFPQIIADCLKKDFPDAKLYVEDVPVGSTEDLGVNDDADLPKLNALLDSKNVRSIMANIEREDLALTRSLLEVIMSSPNLEVLHLCVPKNEEWREGFVADPNIPHDFGALPGDKLPPLRELVYESRFANFPPGTRPLIPSICWDWSRIRHLELRGPNMILLIKGITGRIEYLETLKIENFCYIGFSPVYVTQALNDFISEIRGLVNLELICANVKLPVSAFTRLGATLKRLCYHKPTYPWIRPVWKDDLDELSQEDLGALSEGCPHLTCLTLHMLIHNDLPYKSLAAIARINTLESLRLYAVTRRIRYGWGKNYPGRRVTHLETDILTVKHLAQYLCSHKVGSNFRKIEVVLGDYENGRDDDTLIDIERPIILFTCHIQPNGDIVIEDNSHTVQDTYWKQYLDVDKTSNIPGFTYPQNLEQRIQHGEEADPVLFRFEMEEG